MRILVTGANGYLGRCSLNYLQQNPSYQVLGASRLGGGGLASYGEINRETNWTELLKDIDVVIHTAAVVHQPGVPERVLFQVNTAGSLTLAKAASNSGVKLFIYISTVAVYGNYLGYPFSEENDPRPETAYARSKFEAEAQLSALVTPMTRVILRCPMVYGANAPGNYRRLEWCLRHRIPLPLKNIENQRSFLSSSSFVQALKRILNHNVISRVITVNLTESPSSTRDLAIAMSEFFNVPAPCLFSVPKAMSPVIERFGGLGKIYGQLTGNFVVSGAMFTQLYGWTPPDSKLENIRTFPRAY